MAAWQVHLYYIVPGNDVVHTSHLVRHYSPCDSDVNLVPCIQFKAYPTWFLEIQLAVSTAGLNV